MSYEEIGGELSHELREWRESSPDASAYSAEFYRKVLRYLDLIRQAPELDHADWQFNA